MIERLLAAESALARGELDIAGRLFAQVAEADARNAIAVVGLARIAHREGRADEARELTERALAIDPDEAAAQAPPPPIPTPTPTPTPEPAVPPEPEPVWPTAAIAPAVRPTSVLARLRRWLAGLRGRA